MKRSTQIHKNETRFNFDLCISVRSFVVATAASLAALGLVGNQSA